MLYPVHEMFYTFQGEGSSMGLPAFFIRLYGCPVKCTFCDSAGTWHPDWTPKHVERVGSSALVNAVLQSGCHLAVITGGEPTIFNLWDLTTALRAAQIDVHLETSGAFDIKGLFNWIVLSPKRAELPLSQNIQRANEFKVIVEKPEDIGFFDNVLRAAPSRACVWLHPEWSQRQNVNVLRAIVEAVKTGKGRFRAGWQIHKMYSADALDERSRPLVPLGGEPSKGF